MWKEENDQLIREFQFPDFAKAIGFINQVASIAESLDHHPEIWNLYNQVKISLQTHSAGNKVTELDRMFAAEIDKLLR